MLSKLKPGEQSIHLRCFAFWGFPVLSNISTFIQILRHRPGLYYLLPFQSEERKEEMMPGVVLRGFALPGSFFFYFAGLFLI